MSKLAQSHEDKVVKALLDDLETYKKKLVNAFISQDEIKSTITAENSENENAMAEACKKWDIFWNGGFSALQAYNEKVEDTKQLQKEYEITMGKAVKEFEPKIRKLMKEFDDYIINLVMKSGLFEDVMTNDGITNGKILKL